LPTRPTDNPHAVRPLMNSSFLAARPRRCSMMRWRPSAPRCRPRRSALRLAGVEASFDETGLWAIHVPDVHVLAGAGYSLDRPTRHNTTVYIALRFRP